MKKPKRKYFTEGVLNIYSSEPSISSLTGIYNLDEESYKTLAEHSVYIIGTMPELTIENYSCNNQGFSGFLTKKDGNSKKVKFTSLGGFDKYFLTAQVIGAQRDKIEFFNKNGGSVIFPFPHLFRYISVHGEHEFNHFDIKYIGKSLEAENHNIVERLRSHSKLQKLLVDRESEGSNNYLAILFYRFDHEQYIMSMNGLLDPTNFSDKPAENLMKFHDNQMKKDIRISLAEAALIRHFEPEYNKIYKESFPDSRQKILEEAYKLEFESLVVEINTEDAKILVRSTDIKPFDHHICEFNLRTPDVRQTFFFDEPLNP